MKNLSYAIYIVLAVVLITSCVNNSEDDKYNGLILTDLTSDRVYILKHNYNDTYFVDEQIIKIIENDTLVVFE